MWKIAIPQLRTTVEERKDKISDDLSDAEQLKIEAQSILEEYKTAFRIRKENNIKAGMTISQMRIAKYYLAKKDSSTALSYAKDARDLSIKIQANENYLSSLKLLSIMFYN